MLFIKHNYSSVEEYMPCIYKALSSILRTKIIIIITIIIINYLSRMWRASELIVLFIINIIIIGFCSGLSPGCVLKITSGGT